MTAKGYKLEYTRGNRSPPVSIFDAKIYINSTIYDSHRGARYLGF